MTQAYSNFKSLFCDMGTVKLILNFFLFKMRKKKQLFKQHKN